MRRFATTLLTVIASCNAALAMEEPVPSKLDGRIRSAAYMMTDVIHVTSTDLNPVQIILQDGEQIASFGGLRVASAGKPDEMKKVKDWFFHQSGNTIILQPLKAEKPSMLFVDTVAPDGMARHYHFQIDTRDAAPGTDGDAYDAINVYYPDVIAAQRRAAWLSGEPARERQAAQRAEADHAALVAWHLKQAQTPWAVNQNWHYEAQNIDATDNSCDVIGPEHDAGVSDNGTETRLLFAPHAVMPVPYVLDQDGKESVVQHSQQENADGLIMTIHMVVPKIVLRRGDRVCGLVNMAYDRIGHQLGTGTISPDIVRETNQ